MGGSPGERVRESATARTLHGTGLLPSGLPAPSSVYSLPAGAIVAVPATGQRLYRAVRHGVVDEGAFRSRFSRGERPYAAETPILHVGVSMFASASQAMSRFGRSMEPAEVTLEEGAGFHIAKTLGEGHYTVWGDPEELAMRAVVVDGQDRA